MAESKISFEKRLEELLFELLELARETDTTEDKRERESKLIHLDNAISKARSFVARLYNARNGSARRRPYTDPMF